MQPLIHRFLLTGSLILVLSGSTFAANQHIEITAYRANIRNGARISASLVVTARRGDIFEVLGESPSWYQVRLFSGEPRHIHKSLAKKVIYKLEVPESISLRRQIFESLNAADQRAIQEADKLYPPDTRLRMILDHQAVLRDMYQLQVMHRLNSHVPIYRKLSIEGFRNGW